MNGKIRWNMTDVEKLVELTKFAKVHNKILGYPKVVPGLILVKDQGIYLMSTKTYPAGHTPAGDHEVFYAKGFGPDADWDKVQGVAGGDDFGELIPLTDIEPVIEEMKKNKVDLNNARMAVEFTSENFKIGFGVKK